jgi:hypothetical protein
MGMHFGILCAQMPWPELHLHLVNCTLSNDDKGPLDNLDPVHEYRDSGVALGVGTWQERAYAYDPMMLYSGMDPDFIVHLAKISGKLVIGCGAETVSGSYWFFAAQGGEILRFYSNCHAVLRSPFSIGTPVPTESDLPFDGDLRGRGIIRALQHLGFDYDAWHKNAPKRFMIYHDDFLGKNRPFSNQWESRLNEHSAANSLEDAERPEIAVVCTDPATGKQTITSTGTKFPSSDQLKTVFSPKPLEVHPSTKPPNHWWKF